MWLLASIQFQEQVIGRGNQVGVSGQVVRSEGDATYQLRDNLRPDVVGQRLELVEEFLRRVRHEFRVAPCLVRVKCAVRP